MVVYTMTLDLVELIVWGGATSYSVQDWKRVMRFATWFEIRYCIRGFIYKSQKSRAYKEFPSIKLSFGAHLMIEMHINFL